MNGRNAASGSTSYNPASSSSISSSSSLSSSSWQSKLEEAQDTATKATKLELSKNYNAAFAHYVRAGQLFLWLLNNFPAHGSGSSSSSSYDSHTAPYSREKLKQMATKVMQRAEKIKSLKTHLVEPVQLDPLSHEQQSNVLRTSSTINGVRCPAWSSLPPDCTVTLPRQQLFWTDPDGLLKLSPQQLRKGAVWRRPRTHGPTQNVPTQLPSDALDSRPSRRQLKGKDIVQDIVSDCSFVAALEVACEHDARWGTNLAFQALYPKDRRTGLPISSPDGRYMVKFHINGIGRAVTIDDYLPYYPDPRDSEGGASAAGGNVIHPRLMCASVRDDTDHPGNGSGLLIWPALLEKAYLKLMGGYDFHGSDSSLDLYALTGWIPEQVFLHKSGFQREKAWKRIYSTYYPPSSPGSHDKRASQVMITAGTGASDSAVSVGLVQKHNYAVLDLKETGSNRYVRLMNPWRHSASEPDVAIAIPSHRAKQIFDSSGKQTQEEEEQASQEAALHALLAKQADLNADQSEEDPTFTVTWDDLCTYFDSIYLNWDPETFPYTVRAHSSWTVAEQSTSQHLDAPTPSATSKTGTNNVVKSAATPQSPAGWSAKASFSSIDASQNPQFRLTLAGANSDSVRATAASTGDADLDDETTEEDQVWLLLTRHYPPSTESGMIEKEQATPTERSNSTALAPKESTAAFIAIHVFEPTHSQTQSVSHSGPETAGGGSSFGRAQAQPRTTASVASIAHSTRKTGYYVDGRQTFVRLFPSRALRRSSLTDEVTYTIVPSLQLESHSSTSNPSDVSNSHPRTEHSYNYTLTVYTRLRPIQALCAVQNQFPFKQTFSGSWTHKSAGGNPTFPTFIHNPQYKLTLSRRARVKLTLQTRKSVPVQVVLTYPPHLPGTSTTNGGADTTNARGGGAVDSGDLRVSSLQEGDIILSSGMYNHGFATTSTLYHPTTTSSSRDSADASEAELEAGTYVVICSTFEPNTLADYQLIIETKPIGNHGGGEGQGLLTCKMIPQEGAGMFQRILSSAWKVAPAILGTSDHDAREDGAAAHLNNATRSTAAGSPSHGNYFHNPCWKIRVRKPNTVVMAGLRVNSSTSPGSSTSISAGYPYINLALFRLLSDATSLSSESLLISHGKEIREVGSSGAYADLPAGVLLPKVRLEQDTTYIMIPSTYSPKVEAKFEVSLWFNQPDSLEISPL